MASGRHLARPRPALEGARLLVQKAGRKLFPLLRGLPRPGHSILYSPLDAVLPGVQEYSRAVQTLRDARDRPFSLAGGARVSGQEMGLPEPSREGDRRCESQAPGRMQSCPIRLYLPDTNVEIKFLPISRQSVAAMKPEI